MDCRLPGSSIHGTFQARVLEWVAFSRGSSRPRDQTWVFHVSGRLFTIWATSKAQLEVKMFKRENPFFTPRTSENFLGHYFLMTHAEIQITTLVKLDTVTLWSVSLYINTCSRGTIKGWETARHNVTNRGPEMLAGILLQSLRRIAFTQFSKCKEWLEGQKIADNRTLKPSHSMPKGWGEKGSTTFESREKNPPAGYSSASSFRKPRSLHQSLQPQCPPWGWIPGGSLAWWPCRNDLTSLSHFSYFQNGIMVILFS